METTKPKFISKHKKLLASFFIVALALSAGIVYLRTDGITVGRVNIKASVDDPAPDATNVNSAETVTENLTTTWQGNGTVSVGQLIAWLNQTSIQEGYSALTIPAIITALLNNQTTVSPTLVTVTYLQYSNGDGSINVLFIGNFHLQESWGAINTKQVDFTYVNYGN